MTYLGIIVLALLFISTYVTAAISNYLYNREEVELMANANIVANLIAEDVKTKPKNIEKVVRYFSYRGYSYDDIKSCIERIKDEQDM